MNEGGDMKKTRLIVLFCALTAAAWSLPGLAQAKPRPSKAPQASFSRIASSFDGHSFFDGVSQFDG
jgi:hypothetical protein